jgi:16S rRNA (uracil1498-N3)-methyltransferase
VAAHVFVEDLERPVLGGDDRRHLERVLRLRPGEAVSASDGAGGRRMLRWSGDGRLAPAGDIEWSPRPEPAVAVAFTLVKGDRPEWAVQKLTEIGVDRIVPMLSERAVVRWDRARADKALGRLRTVARGAAMQSRRVWMAEVDDVRTFAGVVASVLAAPAGGAPAGALCVPGGGPPRLDRPTVLVGPEGGWAPGEEGCGLPAMGLGPTVLRAETAAVAAGMLLVALRSGLVAPAG